MTTRDDRDRRIADWLHREAPAAMNDDVLREIVERTRTTAQRRGRWSARGLSLAGPILAATVAVAGVAAVLVIEAQPSSNEGLPVASTPVGTTVTPAGSPEVSVAPSSSASPASWSAIALPDPRPENVQGENPYDVVAGGPGFVAVGRSYAQGDGAFDERQWTPAIWTSVDGASWELAADLASLGPAELLAVASGPDGRLLAVGFDRRGIGPNEEPPTGVGMWMSSDGVRWEAASAPDGNDTFMDVIGTDEGWLVAGSSAGGPTIFTSKDLETWTETRLAGDDEDELDGVFGDGSGRALAFGCDHPVDDGSGLDGFGCQRPTGWLLDGSEWVMLDLPILPVVGAVLADRFVIIGQGEEGAASFSSVDGRNWVRGDVLSGDGFVYSMTVTSDGLAVGGSIQLGEERFLPAVWLSADGQHWEPAEILPVEGSPQEPTVTAIIEAPAGLVGLGYAFYDKPVAQAWIRSR